MKNLWLVGTAAMIVTACATNKTLVPIGGSRADGTVQLAFDYGMFEKPKVDYAAAQAAARQTCQAWGYRDAQPFGGGMNQCIATNQYGCVQTRVIITYQCTSGTAPS